MIQTRRPTAAEIAAGMRGIALPPLRFQRGYRFCLRRVDSAGNHDYDEEYKIDDPPFSTMDGFSNPLISLTNLSYLSQARNRAKLTHAPIAEPQSVCFVPSNDPLPPMLAFPKGRLDPIYKSPKAARSKRERVSTALISVSLKCCPGDDCPESQQPISLLPDPPPPASTGFIRFAYQREQVLFLLSDVLHEDGRPPVRHAAHILPVSAGDPKLHHRVLEHRVGIGEHLLQVHQQGGDPMGIIPVNAVADLQEAHHIPRAAG